MYFFFFIFVTVPLLVQCNDSELDSKFQRLNDRIDELTEALKVKELKNDTLEERVEQLEAQVERLEELGKIHTLRSCAEYGLFGVTKSGYYEVDPDGPLIGNPPFTAYCSFVGGNATTEVTHNHENITEITANPCPDPLCWNMTLTYDAPMSQIETLKELSEFCYQKITFGCFLSGLEANGQPTGVWIDKDGVDQDYFIGANDGSHVCSCGLQSNCSGSSQGYQCNCDNMVPTVQHDRGVITNSSALPILGFKYGLMLYPAQIATINVGRFKCTGKKIISPENIADSCSTLKTFGITDSGHYILNNQNVVFCNMEQQMHDDDIQTHVGFLAYHDVEFLAYKDYSGSYDYIDSGTITFSNEVVDNSNNFDPSSGIFTAPVDGYYYFEFSATSYYYRQYVLVNVNGVTQHYMYENVYSSSDYVHQESFSFSQYLDSGDELSLYASSTNTFKIGYSYSPATFRGYLINKKN